MADEEEDRGFLGLPGLLSDLFSGGNIPSSNPTVIRAGGQDVNRPAPANGTIPLGKLVGGGEPSRPLPDPADYGFGQGGDAVSNNLFAALAEGQRQRELEAAMNGYAPQQTGGGGGDGGRRAAFDSQRSAQVGAYGQLVADLEGLLGTSMSNLDGMTKEQIQGINKQRDLARQDVRGQKRRGTKSIEQDLVALLGLLGINAEQIAAEGEATTSDIRSGAAQGRDAMQSDYLQLMGAGGGRELMAARNEGLATSRNVEGIDAGLVQRLASAAQQDAIRREGSASQVADGATQQLTNNAAAVLGQITAASAQARNQARQGAAERRFELEQQYGQQMAQARMDQRLAAAQRYTGGSSGGSRRAAPLTPEQQVAKMVQEQAIQFGAQQEMERLGILPAAPVEEPTAYDYTYGNEQERSAAIQAALEQQNLPLANFHRGFDPQ